MFKLEDRKKARAYNASVNSGEVKDAKITHGTTETGEVIGDDGKPVSGSAPGGYTTDDEPKNTGTDYTKIKGHENLDKELDKLNLATKPEGWESLKVEEKQAKLKELATPAGGW